MRKVAVIGCGIAGLSTAVAVQARLTHAKVVIFTEDVSPRITSDVAAGIWSPYLLQDTDLKDILKWSSITLNNFLKLWKEGRAEEAGICLQHVIAVSQDKHFPKPYWSSIAVGFTDLSQEHLSTLNRQLHADYKVGFSYVTVACEPTKYLQFLQKRFLENGGEIVQRKIGSFSELHHYDVIVNCAGVQARELAQDEEVVPIRGQVVRVKAPWLFVTFLDEDEGYCAIVNTDTVVLGGTADKGISNKNPSEADHDLILKTCCKMIPALKRVAVVNDMVGLRPSRTKVRLETEIKKHQNKYLKIVHNYGHGGSGVTLSHGCALNAADLVTEALMTTSSKL